MTIQAPPSSRPRIIGVTEPIAPAYERVKQILFKPFDLAKWITIGFCAWLAGLGESGGGVGGFNGGNGGSHHYGQGGQLADQLRRFYREASDYVMGNLYWIVPVAVAVLVLGLALWLLILWLSSRGKFMFLHCVALDKAEVVTPWTQYANAANSLFRFRIVMGLIALVVILPLMVFIALSILGMVLRGGPDVAGVMTVIALVLALLGVAVVVVIIRKFMVDFVVPIMYLRGGSCLAAWREFGQRGELHVIYPLSDCSFLGHRNACADGHPLDVLHRLLSDGAAVPRHSAAAAGAGIQTGVSALLSGAVWSAI